MQNTNMSARERYREQLRTLESWDDFLLENSGLPGPRGNIELAQAVADEGSDKDFARFRTYGSNVAPTNSKYEFLAFCGVLGLGRLLAEGNLQFLSTLREFASDPRWRTREAVAMALQRLGEVNMPALITEMKLWSKGNRLEQRAAVAGLCEPRLLRQPLWAKASLQILDSITASIVDAKDRKSQEFLVLRKGLAYCWSVAVSALPDEGLSQMEEWFAVSDIDVRWIMRENLKKKRLARVDPRWVEEWMLRLNSS